MRSIVQAIAPLEIHTAVKAVENAGNFPTLPGNLRENNGELENIGFGRENSAFNAVP